MDSHQLIPLVLTLVRAGDADLLQDARLRTKLREAGTADLAEAVKVLASIYSEYDYTETPAFEEQVRGKSEAYRSMLQKIFREPMRRAAMREQLLDAFRNLEDSAELLSRVPSKHHQQALKVRYAVLQASGA